MQKVAEAGDRVSAALAFPCHGFMVQYGEEGVITGFTQIGHPIIHWSCGAIGSATWGAIHLC